MFDRWKKRSRWWRPRAQRQRRGRLAGGLERLEPRLLLATTAEGVEFAVNQVLDASRLAGTLAATIDWGDGVVTAAEATSSGGGPLVGRVDYSLDTNNFFDTQLKRDLFQQAVDTVLAQLGDDLAQIVPSAGNTWTAELVHPATGAPLTLPNLQIGANEILIYAGGRELGTDLAVGGPGGFNVTCADASFCTTVTTRGEPGAVGQGPTDFGPWGGFVSLDMTTDFYFSPTIEGIQSSQSDFFSIAMHEVAHILGFGTSPVWGRYTSGTAFNGPASRAAHGGSSVPLSSEGSHWANGTMSDGQEAAMDPSLTTGTRKLLSSLDFAGLDDVGWELVSTNAIVTGSHVYGDDGDYEIVVTVSGGSGGSTSSHTDVSVANIPPTLTAGADQSVGIGQSFVVDNLGVFTDPGFGEAETFTYTVDWGDGSELESGMATVNTVGGPGSSTQGYFDAVHTYAAEGIYTVTLTVSDDDGGMDVATLQMTVVPSISIEFEADQIVENAGINATTLFVRRNAIDISQPLLVALSTDATEVAIPDEIEIPAGEVSVVVTVDAVDDDVLDGTQGVAVTAEASGFLRGSDTIVVTDYEVLSISLEDASVAESAGALATLGTVTRHNVDLESSLLVLVRSDRPAVITLPASVVIPFGQPSVTFPVGVTDNGTIDGTMSVAITVTAIGYESSSKVLQVSDTLSWHNASLRWDVDGDKHVSPIDALRIINDLNMHGSRQLSPPELADIPPYLDVNHDGHVSPVDVLLVVNFLNLNIGFESFEGEASPRGLVVRRAQASIHTEPAAVQFATPTVQPRHVSERQIVLDADQLGDSLTDDLFANLAAALDRFA